MYSITKDINFCYSHRLRVGQGRCRRLHGHNGKAEIELASESLDGKGMVMDFDEVKNRMQGWIDEELDHKLLLAKDDPLVPLLKGANEPFVVMEVINEAADRTGKKFGINWAPGLRLTC